MGADDRHIDCSGASSRGLHRPKPKAIHGTITRRANQQVHAVVDTNGLPVRLALTAGEAHDNRLAGKLLSRLKSGSMLLADHGYDADWIRALAARKGALANIPPRCNRTPICFARISTRLATWSNGSSTRSSTVVGLQRATTSWQRTTSLSFSLNRSDYGCALMSPRPNTTLADSDGR